MFKSNPYIICELGSNWRDRNDITNSIHLIKAMGADALKLQAFTFESMFGHEMLGLTYLNGDGETQFDRRWQLPLEWLPAIKEKCDNAGLDFLCTAFSPELVEAVDPFVSAHKIASSDLTYPQLLKAVAKTGKPVILSTGASSKADVMQALAYLPKDRTVLLYCNSAYPSAHHNLFQLEEMKTLGYPVGISDHSRDAVYTPLSAVRHFGAVVVEKHFTPIPDVDTPDRPHSLDAADFKIMCDHLRGLASSDSFNPTREEKAMMLRHNRRLVASKDIKPGDQLVYGKNYGAYRTLEDDDHGMSPFLWDHEQWGPEGKSAKVEIKQGRGVGPGDF